MLMSPSEQLQHNIERVYRIFLAISYCQLTVNASILIINDKFAILPNLIHSIIIAFLTKYFIYKSICLMSAKSVEF